METPVADFVRQYAASDIARLHMPGHKGRPFLGCEALDITEIAGADALYEASGILRRSEENAASLFGSAATLYSTEGASQCIRAMVYLAVTCRPEGVPPVIVAGRNAHKSFLYAAALADAQIEWLWPERSSSLCSCRITPEGLDAALGGLDAAPAAVYITTPDYLGGQADIPALAEVCRRRGTLLMVDNAHGAYLHFLDPPAGPLDAGAALCCDSAHKTLPVLTGGAYLHIGKNAPPAFAENAKAAMALFGSTSPSYLTLASLDLCNRYLAGDYPARLRQSAARAESIRVRLRERGWRVEPSDPMRITLRGDGAAMAARLRRGGVEPEFSDRDWVVMMLTPENEPRELSRIAEALGRNDLPEKTLPDLPLARGEYVMSPRQALFSPCETVPAAAALGRVCGAPAVSCPPAVPIAISGERIGQEALALFRYYGMREVTVLK